MTWYSGELGGAGIKVGLDDFEGLFQPGSFSDSVTVHKTL